MAITTFEDLKAYGAEHFSADFARLDSTDCGWPEATLMSLDNDESVFCVKIGECTSGHDETKINVMAALDATSGGFLTFAENDVTNAWFWSSTTLCQPFCWGNQDEWLINLQEVEALVRYYFLRNNRAAHLDKINVESFFIDLKEACDCILRVLGVVVNEADSQSTQAEAGSSNTEDEGPSTWTQHNRPRLM